MSKGTSVTRRHALRLLSGAPLLPIASAGWLFPIPAESRSNPSASGVTSVSFTGMPAPNLTNPADMARTFVASGVVVQYDNGSSQSYQLKYEPFFTTGARVPDGNSGTVVAGGYYDIHNQPIVDATDPNHRQFFSDCPDGMSLLSLANASVPGVKGNTVFAVVQFEYTTRNVAGMSMHSLLPSPIAVLTLDQDKTTGQLRLVKYHNIDTSGVKGLWITCGASLSPWNTHLSSEEYEADER